MAQLLVGGVLPHRRGRPVGAGRGPGGGVGRAAQEAGEQVAGGVPRPGGGVGVERPGEADQAQ